MKQMTWMEADNLARELAFRSIGFATEASLAKSLGISKDKAAQLFDDVMTAAKRAAMNGIEAAGALDEDNRRNAARNARLADEANRRHAEWCKATGNPC